MADRILLAQLTDTRRQTRVHRRRSTWIALAAAACVALVIGAVRLQSVTMAFPSMVAAHVVAPEERSAWEKRTPVPVASIEQAFADRGMRLAYVPRDIAYVHECDIGPYRGVHMVMPEGNAPVSVIYVVDHHVFFGRDFRRDGLEGREVPIATGTLVMLAASKDRFAAIEHTWRDAIEGPAQIAAGSL